MQSTSARLIHITKAHHTTLGRNILFYSILSRREESQRKQGRRYTAERLSIMYILSQRKAYLGNKKIERERERERNTVPHLVDKEFGALDPWWTYSEQELQRIVIGSMKGKFSSTGTTSLLSLGNDFLYARYTASSIHLRLILVWRRIQKWGVWLSSNIFLIGGLILS